MGTDCLARKLTMVILPTGLVGHHGHSGTKQLQWLIFGCSISIEKGPTFTGDNFIEQNWFSMES